MKILDLPLAFILILIWGSEFSLGKIGVSYYSPLLLLSLTSLVSFVVARPFVNSNVDSENVLSYKVIILFSVSQFLMQGGLFIALWLGIDIYLSIMLMQISAPLSLVFSWLYSNELISPRQIFGIVITCTGIFIAVTDFDIRSLIPISFVLLSAIGLAWFDLLLKIHPVKNIVSMISYSSFCVFLLFIPLCYLGEAPHLLLIQNAPLDKIFSVIYLGVMHVFSWFVWDYLSTKYKISISSFRLFIPISGIISSNMIFGNSLSFRLISAIIIVFIGHSVTIFTPKCKQ